MNFASKTRQSTTRKKSSVFEANVEKWVKRRGEKLFRSVPSTQVIVMEVACKDPNCAPIDTVIILKNDDIVVRPEAGSISDMALAKGDNYGVLPGKWTGKVPKRCIEVTEEDIELLLIPESLTKEGLENARILEAELLASWKKAGAADAKGPDLSKMVEEKDDDGDMVEVTVDDGWLGRRTVRVRRARVPPPQEDDPKHRKGKGPTGCPCCDPDMFDLLMTRPPV